MEATMQKLAEGMSQLLGERSQERQAQNQTGPAPRAVTRPPALRKPGQAPVTTSMPRVQFPTLDQGVVQAALQAGVPAHSLAQMEKLISQNTKAKKAIEPNKDVVLDPLSEHEEEGLVEVVGPGESGSPPPATLWPLRCQSSRTSCHCLPRTRRRPRAHRSWTLPWTLLRGRHRQMASHWEPGRRQLQQEGRCVQPFWSTRRRSTTHREVYVRGLGFTDSWTGPAAAWAQCTSLGRVPVEDHELQDWSPLRLVLCGHLGRHGGRSLRPRSCSSMSVASSTGPSRNRPRQLDACSGVEPGAKPADDGSCKPSRAQCLRRRVPLFTAPGCEVGRSDPWTPARPR